MPLIPTLLSVCELCSLPSLFPSLHSLGSLWLLQLPQWSPRDLCPWPRFSAAARAPLAPHTPHSPRYVGMHVHTGLLPAFALHWFLTLAFTGVHCFLLSSLLGSPVSSSPYSSLRDFHLLLSAAALDTTASLWSLFRTLDLPPGPAGLLWEPLAAPPFPLSKPRRPSCRGLLSPRPPTSFSVLHRSCCYRVLPCVHVLCAPPARPSSRKARASTIWFTCMSPMASARPEASQALDSSGE